MSKNDSMQPASAQLFGREIRKTVKSLGLDWKVSCRTASFAGLGYGSAPFAEIHCPRKLTDDECRAIAQTIRKVRSTPKSENGGKGIVQMRGTDYPFGGAIHFYDHEDPKLTLSEKLLKDILKESQAEWFDVEEVDDNEALLATREHGDVGDERPGQKDIDAGRRVVTTIRTGYPGIEAKLERVDEWIHVNLKVKNDEKIKTDT